MIYDKGVYRLELNSKRLFREQNISHVLVTKAIFRGPLNN